MRAGNSSAGESGEATPDVGLPHTRLYTFSVRLAATYFSMLVLSMPFDSANGPRRLFDATWGVLNRWFARTLFGVVYDGKAASPLESVSQHLLVILCAASIALLWTSIDGRQITTTRVHERLRVALRYAVGIITMVYAGFKVVPAQFVPPTLEQLSRPLGALAPMGLLWTFMGYSPFYTVFTGLAEWTGAFMLFFRRSTTLGALILAAVMTNVAIMNYAYNVPVKSLSVNLVLANLVLLAPEAGRLWNSLVMNTNMPRRTLDDWQWSSRMLTIRRLLRPTLIVVASALPIVAASLVRINTSRRSPLYGIYDASVVTGISSREDSSTWKRVIFQRPGEMMVIFNSENTHRFRVVVDTTQHEVRFLSRTDTDQFGVLHFDPVDSTLSVERVIDSTSHSRSFRQIDLGARYPLSRSFRWR